MIAAVMAVTVIAQSGPAERLVHFLNSADRRGIAFTAKSGGYVAKARLSHVMPDQQMVAFDTPEGKIDFYQQGKRVLLVLHDSKSYFEYKTRGTMAPPPPEAGMCSDLYPNFLWSFRKLENLKAAKPDGQETVRGIACDRLKVVEAFMGGESTAHFSVAPDGMLLRAVIQPPNNPEIVYDFTEYTWPYFDISSWVYLPPIGYVLGNAPTLHTPVSAGTKVDMKSWKGADFVGMNKKGLALLVTAEGGGPDESLAKGAGEMVAALKKIGVAFAEVHLDGSAPKRAWPVVADPSGAIERQLDLPVTPYILFLDAQGTVLRGWAGYAPDQKKNLVQTALEAYADEG